MTEKSIPLDLLGLKAEDHLVGFRISEGKVIIQFSTSSEPVVAATVQPKRKLGDWGRKWAGCLRLEPGETRESLRAEAMKQRFGE